MLTATERYNIIKQLSKVHHNSVWGVAIKNFNATASTKTDAQVERTVLDLQSQIDDNRNGMKEILGSAFNYIDQLWRKEELNMELHTKQLIQKAVTRYPLRKQQAGALGITVRSLQMKLQEYKLESKF